jgi:hypothetical protein
MREDQVGDRIRRESSVVIDLLSFLHSFLLALEVVYNIIQNSGYWRQVHSLAFVLTIINVVWSSGKRFSTMSRAKGAKYH